MGHAQIARDMKTLWDLVRQEGIDPYAPHASKQLAELAKARNLTYLLASTGTAFEVIDVMRAMYKQEIEHQKQLAALELVTTLPGMTQENSRDTATVIESLISEARRSILLLAYRLTERELLNKLHAYHRQPGTRLRIMVSHEEDLTSIMTRWPDNARPRQVEAFQYVKREDSKIQLHTGEIIYPPFHAKTIVTDGEYCYIGSANFTHGGMSRNVEVGVRVQSEHIASDLWRVAEAFPTRLLHRWDGHQARIISPA